MFDLCKGSFKISPSSPGVQHSLVRESCYHDIVGADGAEQIAIAIFVLLDAMSLFVFVAGGRVLCVERVPGGDLFHLRDAIPSDLKVVWGRRLLAGRHPPLSHSSTNVRKDLAELLVCLAYRSCICILRLHVMVYHHSV